MDCSSTRSLSGASEFQENPRRLSFVEEVKGLLGRVFTPYKVPQRGIAYICNPAETGYIGTDKMFEIQKHISVNGTALKPRQDDFYLYIAAQPIGQEKSSRPILRAIERVLKTIFFFLQPSEPKLVLERMPASLFEGKKEGSTVSYNLDTQPVELKLMQKSHPDPVMRENFQESFLYAKNEVQARAHYAYRKDIPEETPMLNNVALTSKARRISPNGEKEPVTKELLKKLNERYGFEGKLISPIKLGVSNDEKGAILVTLAVCGIEPKDIQLIADVNGVYFMAERSDREVPSESRVILDEIEHTVYTYIGVHGKVKIDEVSYQHGKHGLGYLRIPLGS